MFAESPNPGAFPQPRGAPSHAGAQRCDTHRAERAGHSGLAPGHPHTIPGAWRRGMSCPARGGGDRHVGASVIQGLPHQHPPALTPNALWALAGGISSPPGSPEPGASAGHGQGLFLSRLLLPIDEVLRYWAMDCGSRGERGHRGTGTAPPGAGGGFSPSPIPLGLPNTALRASRSEGNHPLP